MEFWKTRKGQFLRWIAIYTASYCALQWIDTRYELFENELFEKWALPLVLAAILACQIVLYWQVRRKNARNSE